MRTKTSLIKGLALALFTLSAVWVAARAYAAPPKLVVEPKNQSRSIAITESYEERLSALQAERRMLKAGKSTLFVVYQIAKDLRDVELQMSDTPMQRVAALAKYTALVRELEEGAVTARDGVLTREWREDADSALLRAKRDLK